MLGHVLLTTAIIQCWRDDLARTRAKTGFELLVMLRQRICELDIPLWARNRALLYLGNDDRLSVTVRYQLIQVVNGYIGGCDEAAARKGMEWMRQRYQAAGKTPRF